MMTEQPAREIEAKYSVSSPATAKRLLEATEVSAGFAADSAQTVTDLDVYYDTKRFDLLRRGLVLRVRNRDDRVLVTVKGLSPRGGTALRDRMELQSDVDASVGAAPFLHQTSDVLQQSVRNANPADRRLWPILALAQTRSTRNVYAPKKIDGPHEAPSTNALAELSIDIVRVLQKPPDAANAVLDGPIAVFHDIELEYLPDADRSDFEALVTRFDRLRGLRSAPSSKFESGIRARALWSPENALSNIQPDMHMAEACRLIWRQQGIEIVLQEHGVRNTVAGEYDPEYVHDMRVAIRRARTAYELFGHYFRKKDVQPVIDGLRKLGRKLGAVRDLDVAVENLQDAQLALDGESAARLDELVRYTLSQRDAALEALLEWLDSAAHGIVINDFMKLALTSGFGVRQSLADVLMTEPIQVRHCMPSIVLDRFERVRAYESLLASEDDASADQLHALRIQCKYLRYVLEFNRHLLGEEGEALIDHLKAMQDHLGELNDCAVELQRLAKLVSRSNVGADVKAVAQQRMQTVADRRDELRMTLPPLFRDFIQSENRRLLGQAIANI